MATRVSPLDTIRALTAVGRDRALEPAETDRLAFAHYQETKRQKNLPARIVKLRATVRALESELWPEYVEELVRLQNEEDQARRAAIEREFEIHWGSEQ